MNYLDTLLQGEEVEWKKIWEVTTWDKRFNAVENYKQPKTIKYHHLLSNEIKPLIDEKGNVKLLTTNETNYWTTEELAGPIISDSEVVAIPWGGNVIVQYYKGKFLTGDNRIAVSNDTKYLNIKYLYYFLKNNIELLESFYRGAGIKHPSMASVLEIQIPIPRIEIQQKIVAILDSFTELKAELKGELKDRKKQYQYYREKLLSFEEGDVRWKSLGDVCLSITAGGDVPRNSNKGQTAPSDEYPYPIYANATGEGGLYGFTDYYKIECDAVTISARGAKVGYHTIREGKFTPIIRLITLVTNRNIISTKFLNYLLYMIPIGGNDGGIPQLTVPDVKKLHVPIPPLKEQERIVSILDKFNILTNSISEGLPKEIELRKKQYEYYRDLLLTFPKNNIES